ncbi:ROK family protein [Enterococcus sp.]|uniref:ROK family protein n=1 Tax=Enterococcus sp. TaxID=35783 RepID=UPI0028AB748B|nr:ROK family protein [Enterococcus sp.]
MRQVRLCFDVGGTYIKFGVFAQDNTWLSQGKIATPHESKEVFFDALLAKIVEIEQTATIEGIGLSFPGFIDPEQGVAIMAGALAPIHGCNIIKELQERLKGDYPIWIENDARCAALAELSSGHATDVQDFVLITLGTGVGGALVHQRKLIRGSGFRAGEFGMMVTDFQASSFATLHDLASTRGLIDAFRQAKSIPINKEILGETIMEQWDKDPETQQIVRQWARYVAIAIYNLAVTMNPEKILIGGGISQNPVLLPIVRQALKDNPHWLDFQVPLETCRYYNDAGLLGALSLIEQGGKK